MTIRGVDPSGELGKLFFQIQSKSVQEQESGPARSGRQQPSADAVDLSTLVREIPLRVQQVAQEADLRTEKVQHIQQMLENGKNLADAGQVADALTRELFLNELSF